QYGLARVPANQAIVIFLFELVVAAVAAYFLSDERMGVQEWVGAVMIVTASLFSGHMENDQSKEKSHV
ncbi:MAG: EamA family transporter, partial [Betaproteobacteria bacterium]|nr:EamA family transporter [Betaproteobacteria bacterium]